MYPILSYVLMQRVNSTHVVVEASLGGTYKLPPVAHFLREGCARAAADELRAAS